MSGNKVSVEEVNGQIRLLGELTFESVPTIASSYKGLDGGSSTTIDLSGLDKVDSAGLALLLGWVRKARAAGGQLVFSGIPDQLGSLIRISELDSLFLAAGRD